MTILNENPLDQEVITDRQVKKPIKGKTIQDSEV
jgi:hypothetical protein